MNAAWIAGQAVTACKSITLRYFAPRGRLGYYRGIEHEQISSDSCFARRLFELPTALCPCCAHLLNALDASTPPANR